MMTSLKEEHEKVRGKVLSAHNSWRLLFKAKSRRNLQLVRTWITEVIRLTKEVAEQSTKGNSFHYSPVHLPPS